MAKFIDSKATCHLCGESITLRCDSCCPIEMADQLAAIVVCNRCSDFRTATRMAEERIGSLARQLLIGRGGKGRVEEEKRAREAFTTYTKSFCRALAAFYRDPALAWHQDFVELLMERPEKWPDILSKIRASFRKNKPSTQETNASPPDRTSDQPDL